MPEKTNSNVIELNESNLTKIRNNRVVRRIAVIGGVLAAVAVAVKVGSTLSSDDETSSEN